MRDHREEQSSTLPPGQIHRIAIIGGGPAGIAAAKYLLAENTFSLITISEERPSPGGVWLATPDLPPPSTTNPSQSSADQSSPPSSVSPLWPRQSYASPQPKPKHEPEPVYLKDSSWNLESPIYNALTTNLPKQLMRFSDLPFPDEAELMPSHEVVKTYLEEYAKEIDDKGLVKWGRRVTSVLPLKDANGKRVWEVETKHVLDKERSETERFDAVVVANGHYTSPFIPYIPGVKGWCKGETSGEARIIHSKSWRHPPTTKQKILIIGAGISGMDIADMIAKSGSQVLLSSRTFLPAGSMPPMVTHKNIRYVHPVAEFLTPPTDEPPTEVAMPPKRRAVRFKDGSMESEIDQVIFATGYFYDFPFFTKEAEKELGLAVQPMSRTGPVNAILGLWEHLIPRDEPTISFLGLPSRVVPFPVVEVQSAFVARLLAGRLTLPTMEEMLGWESEVIFSRLKDAGTGLKTDIRNLIEEVAKGDAQEINRRARKYVNGDFHTLSGTDPQYINHLSTLCSSAEREGGKVVGKKPPYWDAKTRWMRRMTSIIQKIMREARKNRIQDVREIEKVVGTFEHWKEVEKGGEKAIDAEKKSIARKFGIGGPETQVGY